jgi:diguanylate cyclase
VKGLLFSGSGSGGNHEQVRRQVFLGVTLFAWLGQATVVGLSLVQRLSGQASPVRWDLIYGLALCSVILALLFSRWITLRQIEYGVMVSASLAVAAQLMVAATIPQPLSPHLYFIVMLMFLASFSILPIRQAISYSALLFGAFALLDLTRPLGSDPSLLIFLGVAGVLMVQLSLFGRQISTERLESQIFQNLALTDPLTGLDNRRAMYPRLDEAHAGVTATRVQVRPASMLLLDIDHFKMINDRYGHQLGDQVLQAVAAVLQGSLHGAGEGQVRVARWGGEEFLILFTGDAALQAPVLADQLLYQMRRTPMPGGAPVTFSGGLASSHEAETVPAWLHLADQRQYQAKRQGRNQVQQRAG